jgi:hypothetical protein
LLAQRSELNDSGVIRACCADTRWRNEELFADILRQRGGCRQIDSARLAGVDTDWPADLFPGNDPGQNNPKKIFFLNQ